MSRSGGYIHRYATHPRRWWAVGAIGALVAAGLIALLAGQGDGGATRIYGATAADPLPYDGRSPAIPPAKTERVLVELPRPALGASAQRAKLPDRRQRFYVRSLEQESRALVSALEARGAKLRDVVTFERTWHGFAATIRAKDLPALQSLGARVRANRRFFPAFSQPVPAAGQDAPAPPADAPKVTLLAGGVANSTGYDAVDRDSRPLPSTDLRDPQRREVGGQPLFNALLSLGVRVRVVRVSTLDNGEEAARTDTLLAGLERTVDPDRDGDTSDHDTTALIGVQAPYAGFADAPEAVAVRAAERLGTTVVAPAGENGTGTGTIGSPAPAAVAVGALGAPQAIARTALRVGDVAVTQAAVLAGTPPAEALKTSRPPAANTTAALLVADDKVNGTLAVVEAGANPTARVAAAAGAGAAAVLLADPRSGHVLPTMPAGRVAVPVLGVTGAAAEAILGQDAGATAETSGLTPPKGPFTSGNRSRFAAAGPAYDGTKTPALVRPGSIVAAGELITGSAVAAARVAVDAARGLDIATAPDTEAAPAAPAPVTVSALSASAPGDVSFTLGAFDRGDVSARPPRADHRRPRRPARADAHQGGLRDRGGAPHAARRRARRAARRLRLLAAAQAARPPRPRRLRVPRRGPRAAAEAADHRRLDTHRRQVRTVTLYTRAGCHLCEEAERALGTLDVPFHLDRVDIDSDDELFKRYLERIPVVAVDGEELFDFEVDVAALRRKLLAA